MKLVALSEVCEIVNGGTPKTGVEDYWDGDILWITPKDLGKEINKSTEYTKRTLTQAGIDGSSAKVIPANSVVLSTRAPIGYLVINSKPMSFNQGCKGLIPKSNLDVNYLYYFLRHSKQRLNDLGTGTTFPELSNKALSSVTLPLPPIEQQRLIVVKLDAAFEKIDQAIKLAKSNMDNSQQLFENYILSTINAKEWEWEKLSGIATYFNGLTYKPTDVSASGTIVLRSSNVQDDRLDLNSLVRVTSSIKEKLIVQDGDILMCSRNGSKRLIGKTTMISSVEELMTFGTFMMIVRGRYNPYLIWFFKTKLFRTQLIRGEVTSINQITRYMLDDIMVPLPPEKDYQRVAGEFRDLFEKTRLLKKLYERKIKHLASLRQSMLNRAFSESDVK